MLLSSAMLVCLRAPHGSGGGGDTLYGLPRRQCGLWVFRHFLTSQAKRKIRMLLSKNQWQKRETLAAGCVHVHCWVHGLVWCALGMCSVGVIRTSCCTGQVHWTGNRGGCWCVAAGGGPRGAVGLLCRWHRLGSLLEQFSASCHTGRAEDGWSGLGWPGCGCLATPAWDEPERWCSWWCSQQERPGRKGAAGARGRAGFGCKGDVVAWTRRGVQQWVWIWVRQGRGR